MKRSHSTWAVALVLLASAAPATAHPPPYGRAVATHGVGEARTIAVLTNRGVMLSRDDGTSWSFTCYEAIGYTASQRPPMALTQDGHLLLATFMGAVRSDETLCEYARVDGPLSGNALQTMAADPADPAAYYTSTGVAGIDNGIYRSADDGQSWSLVGETSAQWIYESLRVAPGDPSRVYASGLTLEFAYFVDASTDGGQSWTRQPFALTDEELSVFVLAVDPIDPDTLFAHVLGRDALVTPDRLVRSTDGGQSWQSVLTIDGLSDVIIAPDGSTVWAGGVEGLFRSDDGGATFAQVGELVGISCLAHLDGQLWICGQYGPSDVGVVTSDDGGEHFELRLDFVQVDTVLPCADDSGVARQCAGMPFTEWQREVLGLGAGQDAGRPMVIDTGVVDTAADGGLRFVDTGEPATPPPGADGGCGCRIAGGRHAHDPRDPHEDAPRSGGVLALLVAAIGGRLRRRHRVL